MLDDFPLLSVRVRELLTERASTPREPLLARMEHTLTDGYAYAFALEGECRRIEKQIGELSGRIESADQAIELRGLAERRARAEGELERVRALLRPLRERAVLVRSAVRGTAVETT